MYLKNTWTTEELKKTACFIRNKHLESKPIKTKKVIKPRNDCKEVQWMHWQLKYWCMENLVEFTEEHKFSKNRKYRFDFALPESQYKIGIEYDGLNSEKSGHTTFPGYTSDTEKMNLAISEGWRVLRYTAGNYMNVLNDVKKLVNNGK